MFLRRLKPAAFAILFFAMIPAYAGSTVQLRVVDTFGRPIRGARVVARQNGIDAARSATDAEGAATVPCSAGAKATVEASGFEAERISLGECSSPVAVTLRPAVVRTSLDVKVLDYPSVETFSATSTEIERTTARTAFDAVEMFAPGAFVTRRGVMGYGIANNGTGAVNIRGIGGAPNTDVLVVVDGRPDFEGQMGHPLPDFYTLTDAGEISVTEGPSSVLYGANALGGVVEIKPRVPEGTEFRLTSSMGSYATGQHRLWAATQQGAATFAVAAGVAHTDGDRANSAFHSQDLATDFSYKWSERWNTRLHATYGHFTVDDPGPVTAPVADSWATVGRGGFTLDLANNTQPLAGYLRAFSDFGHNNVSDGFASTDRMTGARLFQTATLPGHVALDFGTDVTNYGGSARNVFGPSFGQHQITDAAGYARFRWNAAPRLRFNAGMRYDDNSVYGSIAVPEFGAAADLSSRVTLSLAAGEGFRNPTLRELYLFPAPNPTLEPVRLWNYQATLQTRIVANLAATITAYYADLSNNIVVLGNYPNMVTTNTGRALNRGIETNARWRVSRRISSTWGYANLRSTNLSPLVPANKANAAIEADLGRAFLHVGTVTVGRRWTTPMHSAQLGGYTTAEAKLTVRAGRHYDAFAGVDNILNRRYEILPGYPMPGVNATGGVSLHF